MSDTDLVVTRTCFVLGRCVTIASNGHEYIAPPFTICATRAEAEEIAAWVYRAVGERLMIEEATFPPRSVLTAEGAQQKEQA